MRLLLSTVPADTVGIYTINGVPNRMPARSLFLAPEAAASFRTKLHQFVVISDALRSAESSLNAVKRGRGAQPPGYSAHNYGLAIDLSTTATRRRGSIKSKAVLDEIMEAHGWFCHRRDHLLEHESWHYNFLGVGYKVSPKQRTTSPDVEALMLQRYGADLAPNDTECQVMLKELRMYSGAIDGDIGPLSREAISAFQRAWASPKLHTTGKLDDRTRRTLAFVTAEREVVA